MFNAMFTFKIFEIAYKAVNDNLCFWSMHILLIKAFMKRGFHMIFVDCRESYKIIVKSLSDYAGPLSEPGQSYSCFECSFNSVNETYRVS